MPRADLERRGLLVKLTETRRLAPFRSAAPASAAGSRRIAQSSSLSADWSRTRCASDRPERLSVGYAGLASLHGEAATVVHFGAPPPGRRRLRLARPVGDKPVIATIACSVAPPQINGNGFKSHRYRHCKPLVRRGFAFLGRRGRLQVGRRPSSRAEGLACRRPQRVSSVIKEARIGAEAADDRRVCVGALAARAPHAAWGAAGRRGFCPLRLSLGTTRRSVSVSFDRCRQVSAAANPACTRSRIETASWSVPSWPSTRTAISVNWTSARPTTPRSSSSPIRSPDSSRADRSGNEGVLRCQGFVFRCR